VNVYQRVTKIREAVDYIQKDKKVEGGGYMAVTHDGVTALTRKHFIEQGVVIVPACVVQSSVKETGTTTKNGTPFIRFEARYRFDVVNMDEPTDKFSIEIEAHALDQGDKAPGKALSYAKKYAVLKLLEIESGEEDEAREEQHKPKESKVTPNAGAGEALTEKQRSMVRDTHTQVLDALAEERDMDAYALCESLTELEDKLYLWSLLDSKARSRIKAQQKRERESEARKSTLKAV
jgi:hypothetical protein